MPPASHTPFAIRRCCLGLSDETAIRSFFFGRSIHAGSSNGANHTLHFSRSQRRKNVNDANAAAKLLPFDTASELTKPTIPAQGRPLKHLSTVSLVRSMFLSRMFCSPWLSSIGISVLKRIALSKSAFLDPDRNWVMNRMLRLIVYDQFCAGTKPSQISKTVAAIKGMGYTGVILNYARELVENEHHEGKLSEEAVNQQIQRWLDDNLSTLSMLEANDYLGVKYTGAGPSVAHALHNGEQPSEKFQSALHKLCRQVQAKGARILIDAEHQVYQPTIDRWTVDVMRTFNKTNQPALILNTYQSYLKASRGILRDHLLQAQKEGWTLGVKLVRGAYISDEVRSTIHDTKADTDANYNGIARDILLRDFDGIKENFPSVKLFLAGHNAGSIQEATALQKDLIARGQAQDVLEFGQLYGMADHISGELLAQSELAKQQSTSLSPEQAEIRWKAVPHIFKCVNWGSVRECLWFLMRRATENQGAADRLRDGLEESKKELKNRLLLR